MSNMSLENIATALRNSIASLAEANGHTTEALLAAIAAHNNIERATESERSSARRSSSRCCSAPVEFNKLRTIVKVDCPGFTNESLTVTVKSNASHDILVINGSNEFRQKYEEVIVCPEGMRLDRATAGAQLRLGVLKVTGRTYKRSTPVERIDMSTKRIPVRMVNG